MSKLMGTLDPKLLRRVDVELNGLRAKHPTLPDYELVAYALALRLEQPEERISDAEIRALRSMPAYADSPVALSYVVPELECALWELTERRRLARRTP